MAINSVRTALQLLSGAGEMTRAKALEAAGTLLELPGVGETSARAGQLAEELIEAATANRQLVSELVRSEVDDRLALLGFARAGDLAALERKVEALEREIADLRLRVADGTGRTGPQATKLAPAKTDGKATPKKTAARKTAARETAKKVPARKAPTKTPPATGPEKSTPGTP